jgi:hypothetical protein
VTTVRPDGRRVSWIGSSMVAGSLPECQLSEYGVAAAGATRRVQAVSSYHVPWRVVCSTAVLGIEVRKQEDIQ